MKDLEKYLDYLKYNKNYSDKTIINYELDLKDYFLFLQSESLDYKDIEYDDLRFLFDHFEKLKRSRHRLLVLFEERGGQKRMPEVQDSE